MVESDTDIRKKREISCIHKPLKDTFGRPVNYLRISLTQRCNHSCFFCHAEGESFTGSEMTPFEIERLVRMATGHGVTRVKLTGGEPLLRSDLLEIISRLSPIVEDLSLTTNGSLLQQMAADLKAAGLDRVNVSLHSLDQISFEEITGSKNLSNVKSGIKKAKEVGLSPLKINMTILRELNVSEIQAMMEFAASTDTILQLIEVQDIPIDSESNLEHHRYILKELEEQFNDTAIKIIHGSLHDRRQYSVPTLKGVARVEIVKPMHNAEFCRSCTRLRVTTDGMLKPCLYRSDNLVHVRSYLSESKSDSELLQAYATAIEHRKPYWRKGDGID
ncbi:MAG: GTP 3',8-cyclase MoaA [Candidatus Thorarchaeota archaeon]